MISIRIRLFGPWYSLCLFIASARLKMKPNFRKRFGQGNEFFLDRDEKPYFQAELLVDLIRVLEVTCELF